MQKLVIVAATLTLMTLVGCGESLETRWSAHPAASFASLEELAEELQSEGLCDEVSPVPRAKLYPMGYCHPQGEEFQDIDLLVAIFPDENVGRKIKRADGTGCNGPMVWGPNWSVGPLAYENIDAILEAIGGEVVGASETRRC